MNREPEGFIKVKSGEDDEYNGYYFSRRAFQPNGRE